MITVTSHSDALHGPTSAKALADLNGSIRHLRHQEAFPLRMPERRRRGRVTGGRPEPPTRALTLVSASATVARTARPPEAPIRSAASRAPWAALFTRASTSAPSCRAASAVPSSALPATRPTSPPTSWVALTAPLVADFAASPSSPPISSAASMVPMMACLATLPRSAPISLAARIAPRAAVTAAAAISPPTSRAPDRTAIRVFLTRFRTPTETIPPLLIALRIVSSGRAVVADRLSSAGTLSARVARFVAESETLCLVAIALPLVLGWFGSPAAPAP